MEMEQDKTGRSKMLRLLLLFLIPGIIIQKTWKAARMPRAFLNFLSEYDERILLTFNATEHKIKAS